MSTPATIRPAATVVVMRDAPRGPEIFMVRRHEGTAFMGGAYVFPGGRVDAADFEFAGDDPLAPYRMAALRELFEEAGVLLARDGHGAFVSLADAATQGRFGAYRHEVHEGRLSLADLASRERLQLAPDALVAFAHWVTPPIDVRQFDTRFFLARVPPEQTPVHDEQETTHGAWMTAAGAIARASKDEIILPPPTWTTLRELEPFADVESAMAWARARRIRRREPLYREDGDVRMLLLPGDPLNPDTWDEPSPRETRFVKVAGRWRAQAAPEERNK